MGEMEEWHGLVKWKKEYTAKSKELLISASLDTFFVNQEQTNKNKIINKAIKDSDMMSIRKH